MFYKMKKLASFLLTLNASIAAQVKLWIYWFACTSEAFLMQFFQASFVLILNNSI